MEETLARLLDLYAEKSEKLSRRNSTGERKAYMSGKAEGLRQARALLLMLSHAASAERGELAEASR